VRCNRRVQRLLQMPQMQSPSLQSAFEVQRLSQLVSLPLPPCTTLPQAATTLPLAASAAINKIKQ